MAVTTPIKPTSIKAPSMFSSRRHARQLALQQLFQWEFDQSQKMEIEEIRAGRSTSPEVREFANQIVQGVLDQRSELDQLINR